MNKAIALVIGGGRECSRRARAFPVRARRDFENLLKLSRVHRHSAAVTICAPLKRRPNVSPTLSHLVNTGRCLFRACVTISDKMSVMLHPVMIASHRVRGPGASASQAT